jgi:hypothetical protein
MFDSVQIVRTAETIATGHADRTGACHGFTTPSVTGVSVIGDTGNDRALNVAFDDGTAAWFDPSLVAFLDFNAGQVMTIGEKSFVREATGEWVESADPGLPRIERSLPSRLRRSATEFKRRFQGR